MALENLKENKVRTILFKLIKSLVYAVIEITASQAFILLLKDRISDALVYGVVIVVIMTVSKAIKEVLGEEHPVTKVL